MIMTVFRSRLRTGIEPEYLPLAARMTELVVGMPGYVSHKHFLAEDGERLTLVQFDSLDAQEAWRTHAEHVHAQCRGRESFYAEYSLTVCEVLRQSDFAANPPGARHRGAPT